MLIRGAVYHTGKKGAAKSILGYCEYDVRNSGDTIDLGALRYNEAEYRGIIYILNQYKDNVDSLHLKWRNSAAVELVNGTQYTKNKWEQSLIMKIRKLSESIKFILEHESRFLMAMAYGKAKSFAYTPKEIAIDTSPPHWDITIHETHSDDVRDLGEWMLESVDKIPMKPFKLTHCVGISNVNGFYREICKSLSAESNKFSEQSLYDRLSALREYVDER